MSLIDRNASLEPFKGSIPSLSEIKDRFYDINSSIYVKVDHTGYVRELNGMAPFTGICSVRNVINMLNRDINVIPVKDSDLVKLRNSIIFYNEYFCPSEDNVAGYKPAPIAFDRIESKYVTYMGKTEQDIKSNNPFKNNIFEGIVNDYDFDADEAFAQYMKKRRAEETKFRSSKFKGNDSKSKKEIETLHSSICKSIPRTVDLSNYEYCFEECEYYPD